MFACIISAFIGSWILSDRRNNSPKREKTKRAGKNKSKKAEKKPFLFFLRKKGRTK
jgi:hypothetical protein